MNRGTKNLLLAALFATALPTLQGCAPVIIAGAGAGVLSAVDRRSLGTQTEDETLEWKAANRIDEKFGNKVHINQTSYNRKLLLTGEAPSAEMKAEIEQIAAALPNARGVWNEIQIAAPSSFSARSNDAYLTSKVKARFIDANRFRVNLVKVVTEAGTVHLLGMVTQAEANAAIDVARTTGGVLKVVNVMEIITPEKARELDLPPPDTGRPQPPAPVRN